MLKRIHEKAAFERLFLFLLKYVPYLCSLNQIAKNMKKFILWIPFIGVLYEWYRLSKDIFTKTIPFI